MNNHTSHFLTYEMGEYTGENWLLATVDFGTDDEDNDIIGYIVTDNVHASDFEMGDPEADLRLWAASPVLYQACKLALKHIDTTTEEGRLAVLKIEAAIRRVDG